MTGLPAEVQSRRLGEFALREKLGEGGFGTVYRAEQVTLGRPAVVKVIRSSLLGRQETVDRFTLEARLASRFDHPYAAHVYAFGVEPDRSMWIAMELVDGTPLDQFIERTGPMPLAQFVPVFERLCDVIQSAHDQQIIHRDIKPSNVMVISRAGRLLPKLLDFGIAKTIGALAPMPPNTTTGPRLQLGDSHVAFEHTAVGASAAIDNTVGSASASAATDNTVDVGTSSASSSTQTSSRSASLTREGQILGSPPYMAPEQWLDAGKVGPWTDQYALALLSYEVITGKRAFESSSLDGWYRAHEERPLPPLPRELPAAIHTVLARAAAKSASDRFPTLTELARAFRAAAVDAGVVDDGTPAIELPFDVRAAWIADAPQPIADAVAALSATRTPSRVADRARVLGAVIARWLGLLALACQSRVGRMISGTPTHTLALEARRRALRDSEWLELIAAVAKQFEKAPTACAIPELATARLDDLRELVRDDVFDADDENTQRRARAATDRVVRVLGALEWLLDYELVRATLDGSELWMGASTDDRAVRSGASHDVGAILLLDADGAQRLRLSPLVQIARPLPGEREEMFLFVGPSHRAEASRSRSFPKGFERDDHDVWPWFASQLLDVQDVANEDADGERSPFPGLAAFTAADHDSFVGREVETEEALNRLQTHAIVAVVGPSGVGKSSFLAAGVIPALPASWRAVVLRPGANPNSALRDVIARYGSPYRDRLDGSPTDPIAVGEALAAVAREAGTTLLVAIDQAEELFTMCNTSEAREAFARSLLVATERGRVRVILSLRDDYLCRTDELAGWRGVITRSVQVLRVPAAADLERALRVPARRHGYELDDPTLPATIVADVGARPGALPLVAFVAATLWEKRDRHFKRLTKSAYDEVGGVSGALVGHADGVVDAMTTPDRRIVREVFRRLLTTEGTRAHVGRAELVDAIGEGAARVIDRLIGARLVVTRDDDAGERIEIVHECLVSTWPRLASWRLEDAASSRMHERLTAAAKHWDEKSRPPGLLWQGAALADLARLRREEVSLSVIERAFCDASERAARLARRRRLVVVASAFGILAIGAGGLAWANRSISKQREEAVERLALGFEERARLELDRGDVMRSVLFLAESRRLGTSGPAGDLIAAEAAAALQSQTRVVGRLKGGLHRSELGDREITIFASDSSVHVMSFDGHTRQIATDALTALQVDGTSIVFGKDHVLHGIAGEQQWTRRVEGMTAWFQFYGGAGVVIGFGPNLQLWNASDGTPRGQMTLDAPIQNAMIDPMGKLVAAGSVRGKIGVWDLATLAPVANCPDIRGGGASLTFTGDGTHLVTGNVDGSLTACDLRTGAHRELVGHRARPGFYAIAKTAFASATRAGSVIIWDFEKGRSVAAVEHGSGIAIMKFSEDAKLLATGGDNGIVRLWNAETGTALGSLQGHAGTITALAWNAMELTTGSRDGTIRRWDVRRAMRASLDRHGAHIIEIGVGPESTMTAASDGNVIVWSRSTHTPLAKLGLGALRYAAMSKDGTRIVAVDGDGRARLYASTGAVLYDLPAAHPIVGATFLPPTAGLGSNSFVIGDDAGTIQIRRGDGTLAGTVSVGAAAVRFEAHPSGRWLSSTPEWDSPGPLTIIDLQQLRVATQVPSDIHALAFLDDRLAVPHNNELSVYELGTWRVIARQIFPARIQDVFALRGGALVVSTKDSNLYWTDRDMKQRMSLSTDGEMMLELVESPDGSLLASVGSQGALRVFDSQTRAALLTIPLHRSFANAAQFTPDGRFLVTAGADGTAVTRDLSHPPRSAKELAELVRCRVPFRLEGEQVMPRELDFDDPSCR